LTNLKKDIIPLLISILLILISLLIVLTTDKIFNQSHYIGIACLTLSTLLYFKSKKIYFYFFALTLVAGLFGLLDFFYANIRIGFWKFGINPVFIILIILFFSFSKNTMNELFPEKKKSSD